MISRASFSHRLARSWPWLIMFLPGIVILVLLWPLRVSLPHLDAWSFVQQYNHWAEGRYGWDEFMAPHYIHPSAVGKVIYFAVLHWMGGNIAILPLLMWFIAAVIAACVCHLARPLWQNDRARGGMLMLLSGLAIFSAAQGEVWIWGFLFQNSVPGACLGLGLVLLSGVWPSAWRMVAAGLLTAIATFSFGSGPLVGVLLSLSIWHGMHGASVSRRLAVVLPWLAFVSVITWVALSAKGGSEEAISAGILLDHPGMRIHFVFILLAQMLGKGTVFEPAVLCALLGVILLVTFVACVLHVYRRRANHELVTQSLPWIIFALFGLGNALAICVARSFNSIANSLEERYSALTLFFLLGVVLLVATILRHAAPTPAPILLRSLRAATVPALVLLFTAHAVNWGKGWHAMQLKSKNMEQERAMLAFVQILPPDADWMGQRLTRKSTLTMARYLASKGRLQDVTFVPDTQVSSLPKGQQAPKQWSRFDKPLLENDGRWSLRGIGGLSADNAADLVLITAEAEGRKEQIIAFTAPLLPEAFFEREAQTRKHADHYLGWRQSVEPSLLPSGEVTLRAYVFEQDERRLRPMEGVHRVQAPST